ncbi:MAG TPA: DUF3048 domain-containing protein [Halanaerobiales bacterium]|nr:DUF3048 domain-containing protein [Halanaerobiales bacterium]
MKYKRKKYFILFILIIIILQVITPTKIKAQKYNFSPFSGRVIQEKFFQNAVMAVIENSKQARPQSGLNSAPIVYEYLVEGGITRFLALYWYEIPNKIGPIRSARPYLIKTSNSYKSILLHAGASPAGFNILQNNDIKHIDQIYNGNYFWRGSEKKIPHNLFTGYFKISDYLNNRTGQEYQSRFEFKDLSFINIEKIEAKKIKIDYWGNYEVNYEYDIKNNVYKRYLNDFETPHLNQNNEQITVKNILVKFVETKSKDDQGRLEMKINGTGKAYYFIDGEFIEGKWKKEEGEWTVFYNNENKEVKLNPGKTWIQVVPTSSEIKYEKGDNNGKRN